MIWDFRGPDAQKTAKHHCIHLHEFTASEKLTSHGSDTIPYSDYHSIAYLIVDEKEMLIFRDALKPHRAEVAPE